MPVPDPRLAEHTRMVMEMVLRLLRRCTAEYIRRSPMAPACPRGGGSPGGWRILVGRSVSDGCLRLNPPPPEGGGFQKGFPPGVYVEGGRPLETEERAGAAVPRPPDRVIHDDRGVEPQRAGGRKPVPGRSDPRPAGHRQPPYERHAPPPHTCTRLQRQRSNVNG